MINCIYQIVSYTAIDQFQLTHNIQISQLAFHWIGVDLTLSIKNISLDNQLNKLRTVYAVLYHVPSFIFLFDIFYA